MIVTGHQPNYLPYAGFFEKMARADLFVIVDDVQFVKRGPFGWIHRNRIRSGDGWDWLTVPVLTKGKFEQTIRDTQINARLPWARKHWRTIEWNYRKAPHFERYAEGLKGVYDRSWTSLCELNLALIRVLMNQLGIDTPVRIASKEGIGGKSTDLVLDICRKTGADTYISGIHGKDYLSREAFEEEGVRLEFQEYDAPRYPQTGPGDFVPNLSVIDLIFNCGPDSLAVILDKND